MIRKTIPVFFLVLISSAFAASETTTISVSVDKPGAAISPAMWGLFFEDINFGADGGLYGELIKNRSFEFPEQLMGWSTAGAASLGSLSVHEDNPAFSNNPHYLRLSASSATGFGVVNEGFRGIGVRSGESYAFSVTAREVSSGATGLRIELINPSGAVLADANIPNLPKSWQRVEAVLQPSVTEENARLRVSVLRTGSVDLDQVSLFPEKTWKNRPGGLRADIVQVLSDMHPGFLRFPGGCIVEGSRLALRYRWKDTIGPVEQRRILFNRWNAEFKDHAAPDYYQSFGLGFFEYFQLCEDIGAAPLPILNCGMACQFNSGELAALDDLQPFIQDALDLIEFANGPADSLWGAKRAAMGHREPFHLTMIGVGNEQWGPQYFERYARFTKVLKKAHPEISLVAASGPSPADERFNYAWSRSRDLHADFVDEHCYSDPNWFLTNSHRYDGYDRKGPKVFMGEYAAQVSGKVEGGPRPNTLECALAEAAFMTGMERNADLVRMASYAPLLANAHAWQWAPDLIWVDNLNVRRTPDYWVQFLFSRNRGDHVLPCTIMGDSSKSHDGAAPLYVSSVIDGAEVVIKLVHVGAEPLNISILLDGISKVRAGTATVLTGQGPNSENLTSAPDAVTPRTVTFDPMASRFSYELPPWSVVVLRLPVTR